MIYREEDHSLSIRFVAPYGDSSYTSFDYFNINIKIIRIYTNPLKKIILYDKFENAYGQGSTLMKGKKIVDPQTYLENSNTCYEANFNISSGFLQKLEDGDLSIEMIVGNHIFVYRNIDRLTTIKEKYLGIEMPHIPRKLVVNQCHDKLLFSQLTDRNSEDSILIKERNSNIYSPPNYVSNLHKYDYAVNKISFQANQKAGSVGISEISYISTRKYDNFSGNSEYPSLIGNDNKKLYKFLLHETNNMAKKHTLIMQYASNVQAVISLVQADMTTKLEGVKDIILNPTNGEFVDFAMVLETGSVNTFKVICSFPDEYGNFVSTRLVSIVISEPGINSGLKPLNQYYPYQDTEGELGTHDAYNLKIIDFWLYSLKDLNVQIDDFRKSARPGHSNPDKFVRYALVWSEEVLNQYESGKDNNSYISTTLNQFKNGKFLGLRDAFINTKRYANSNMDNSSDLYPEREKGFNHFIAPRRASLLIWNKMVVENPTSTPASSTILRIKRIDQKTPTNILLELTTGS